MAEIGVKRGRTANNTEAENNLITVNGNNENTPSRVRQADADLGASSPNFIDDNFDANIDGSLEYSIDPTAGWSNDPVHDLKWPHKKYVDDALGYLDTKTFYLSNEGDDASAEPGNMRRPYQTITALISALTSEPANSTLAIKVFPGSYSGDFIISSGNYTLSFAIIGCTWTNVKFSFSGTNVVYMNLANSVFSKTSDNVFAFEGSVDGYLFGPAIINVDGGGIQVPQRAGIRSASGQKYFYNLRVNAINQGNCIYGNNANIYNCEFFATDGFALSSSINMKFFSCIFNSSNSDGTIRDSGSLPSFFYNCRITNSSGIAIGSVDNNSDSFYECYIESAGSYAVRLNGNGIWDTEFTYSRCIIKGASDSVRITGAPTTSTDIFFEYCRMEAGTGEIFLEPGGGYDPGFVNNIRVIAPFFNKTFIPAGAGKIVLYNEMVL